MIKFVLYGRPLVQKNNLNVYKKTIKGGRKIPFVGHSKELMEARDEASFTLHQQYIDQGYTEPIDYLFRVHIVFYVEKRSEPDLDNLPAFVLDALQGIRDKKKKTVEYQVIKDDKLLRLEMSEKIVKGDEKYHGEPRTEITISRYDGSGFNSADGSPVSGSDRCEEQGSKISF